MTKTEYIKKMYVILSNMCAYHGYHNVAAGMIAQSIQEGWNSGLATKYYNYWGMKAGKSYQGRTVAMNNKAGNDPAVYRVYNSMEDGCEGYFTFLAYPRYKALKNCTTDSEFLDKIGPCGWNGNPGYGDRCKSHLKEVYEALRDTSQPTPKPTSAPTYSWVVGKTYSTRQDLYIREEPNGEKKDWDDITDNAKKHGFKDEFGKAILNRGARVTVKNIKTVGNTVWLEIPSGYICGKNSKITYVY